jgi:hypothetical protein
LHQYNGDFDIEDVVLERTILERGQPVAIRCDNGPEITSRHFLAWTIERRIDVVHIWPGKPVENAYVESFHGRLRDECLNVSWFWNLFDARRKISAWQRDYSFQRPHSSLSYRTPNEFARLWRLASPSCISDTAESRPPQGDPDRLRFAPALTQPALCQQPIFQGRSNKRNHAMISDTQSDEEFRSLIPVLAMGKFPVRMNDITKVHPMVHVKGVNVGNSSEEKTIIGVLSESGQ